MSWIALRENIITKLAIAGGIGIFIVLVYIQGLIFSALLKECSGLNGIEYVCRSLNTLPTFVVGGLMCSVIFIVISIIYCCTKGCRALCRQYATEYDEPLLPK